MAVRPYSGRKAAPGRKERPPFDDAGLEQAALNYAGRYATSRARLAAYLDRKLRERGWAGPGAPPVARLVERMAALGYVDDRAFAAARAASLGRRGYGERRVAEALRAAGIEEPDAGAAREAAREGAWSAALRFAERRRIGPFASAEPSREAREKALAALLRAGHPADLARRLAHAVPGEVPEADVF
ncbi:MAG: regulatory protein RecX [Allosphingosinicella sp.]